MLTRLQALLFLSSASRTLAIKARFYSTSHILASFSYQKFGYIACLILRLQKVLIIGISLLTNRVYTIEITHVLYRTWASSRASTVLVLVIWCSCTKIEVALPHWWALVGLLSLRRVITASYDLTPVALWVWMIWVTRGKVWILITLDSICRNLKVILIIVIIEWDSHILPSSLEFRFDMEVSFGWPFAIGMGLGLLHRFKVLSLGKIL